MSYRTLAPDFDMGQTVMDALYGDRPGGVQITNLEEANDLLTRWHEDVALAAGDGPFDIGEPPGFDIIVTIPDFAPDLFFFGPHLFSARARDIMDLGCSVAWLPVNMAGSTEAIMAQDYRMLRPLYRAPVLDIDHAGGQWIEYPASGGGTIRQWTGPVVSGPDSPAMKVRWRRDVHPGAELFMETHMHWLLATEALANRVMVAGCTGIQFIAYGND